MRRSLQLVSTCATLTFALGAVSFPAFAAKDESVEGRVNRLEKEMRAVQRKVFPGGTPVEPDIQAQTGTQAAVPSSTPVTDLMARVTALESQLATITGQVEQNSYKLRQIEQQLQLFPEPF